MAIGDPLTQNGSSNDLPQKEGLKCCSARVPLKSRSVLLDAGLQLEAQEHTDTDSVSDAVSVLGQKESKAALARRQSWAQMLVRNSRLSPWAQADCPPTAVEFSRLVISEENRPTTVPK